MSGLHQDSDIRINIRDPITRYIQETEGDYKDGATDRITNTIRREEETMGDCCVITISVCFIWFSIFFFNILFWATADEAYWAPLFLLFFLLIYIAYSSFFFACTDPVRDLEQ